VAAGAGLGLLLLLLLWTAGVVPPPEALASRVAAISAVFPGPAGDAEVQRIPCPPLRRLRLYVVCTDGCEGVWRIVAVRGLRPENLANLNRTPPEPAEESRGRISAAVEREGLRLDAAGAREMIGCYLRLDGLHPDLVLEESDHRSLEEARGDDEAMRRVAEGLEDPGAIARVPVEETPEGFAARFLYWQTARADRPVLEIEYRLARDGQVLSVRARALSPGDGTASGSTPGTPPS
jgi:hypothetical protein